MDKQAYDDVGSRAAPCLGLQVVEQHLLSHLHLVHVWEGIGCEETNSLRRQQIGRASVKEEAKSACEEGMTESGGRETTEFIETPIGRELNVVQQ